VIESVLLLSGQFPRLQDPAVCLATVLAVLDSHAPVERLLVSIDSGWIILVKTGPEVERRFSLATQEPTEYNRGFDDPLVHALSFSR